jgi:uncharacterized repeat protein (TIGR01451 family)
MTMQMNNSQTLSRALIAAIALNSMSVVCASENCIELTTTAESEQQYVNERGQKATRLVALEKPVPGSEVVWTVTAKNVCSEPIESVVIVNPVPEHMTYVASSAMGVGTQITYSLDGKEFKAPAALTLTDAGATRTAKPEEYRAIRWTYQASFTPGTTAFVRYRARVN